jgi:signal transduction histidine kinase
MDRTVRDWYRMNQLAGDTAVAVCFFLVTLMLGYLVGVGGSWNVGLTVLLSAPLVLRRAEPEMMLVGTLVVCLVQVAAARPPIVADLAVLVVVHAVSAYSSGVWRYAALVAGIVGAGLGAVIWSSPISNPQQTVVVFGLAAVSVGIAFLIGDRQRDRADREHEQTESRAERERLLTIERDQRSEMAAATERARIARELHDIVAHSLSVIVVQADGGLAASRTKPEVAPQVLATIAETSRDALAEMRRMVAVLRAGGAPESDHPDYAPAPTAADLPELVDQVRRAGLPVDLVIAGAERPVGPAVGLTMYRVVQESLTNVLKHAGPQAHAEVSVYYGPADVTVTVLDDGRGAAATAPLDRIGNGLLGMRERVELLGGSLAAHPRPGGGFLVSASVPAGRPETGTAKA